MVLEYLPTWLGDFWGFYVGKYSSTMEHITYDHLCIPYMISQGLDWTVSMNFPIFGPNSATKKLTTQLRLLDLVNLFYSDAQKMAQK